MKALLLDVGNTRLKWGIAENGVIRRTGHVTQARIRQLGLAVLTSRLPRRVDAVMVSNVAGPTFATRLAGLIGAHCACDAHFAMTARRALGVTNGYTRVRQMGVDRWVAMIAAWAEMQSACLVVDAGTAVTIDAIDDHGRHLGGQIIPGVGLMATALNNNTSDIPAARLPRADRFQDMNMFASSTGNAVASGALSAVSGAIERSIQTLRSNMHEAAVILTGGDASRILTALGDSALHRPSLVLQGLLNLLEAE